MQICLAYRRHSFKHTVLIKGGTLNLRGGREALDLCVAGSMHSYNNSYHSESYMYIPFVISMVEPGQTKVTQFELAPAIIKECKSINTHRYVYMVNTLSCVGFVCMHVVSLSQSWGKCYMYVARITHSMQATCISKGYNIGHVYHMKFNRFIFYYQSQI